MIKQILTATALVAFLSAAPAMAQSGGGAAGGDNTGRGVESNTGGGSLGGSGSGAGGNQVGAPAARDQGSGMYRDAQGKPCQAGSAGCTRTDDKSNKSMTK